MRNACLRVGNGIDLAPGKMDAMAQYRSGCQQAALLVHVGIIGRPHVQMMDFFNLLAVLRQMRLQISIQTSSQFRCASQHSFRASHGKPWAESIFEPATFAPMPFAAQPFTLDQRDRKNFLWLKLTVGTNVHHHLAHDDAKSALPGGFKANVAAVFVDGCVTQGSRSPLARQVEKELRRFDSGLRSAEVAPAGEDM